MRHRHQVGTVVERPGCFLIKHYIREADGSTRQVAEKLCDKAPEYFIKRGKLRGRKLPKVYLSDALRQKRDDFMRKLGTVPPPSAGPLLITDFWTEVFLPVAERKCSATTVAGYRKIWNGDLEPHFRGRKFTEYRLADAREFLTSLAARELKNGSEEKGLSRNTLQHVRSLANSMFRLARSRELTFVDWYDAVVETRVRRPKGNTPHYTEEEVKLCLELLKVDLEARAAFACACFLGLRTREVTRLRWEDVGKDAVFVRGTKTEGAVRRIPLIEPLCGILCDWREKRGNPTTGWVFENRYGDGPKSTAAFMGQRYLPLLGKLWKGLYAGRRGASTEGWRATKDLQVPAQLMGHENTTTAQKHYTKYDYEALERAMKLREAEFAKLQVKESFQ